MVTTRSCGTCMAFARMSDEQGTCRAKPPVGIPQMQMNPVSQQMQLRMLAGWPPVTPNEWCCEWKPSHEHTN